MVQGLSYERVEAVRKAHQNPGVKPFYSKPLLVNAAFKQWLWDHEGTRYLDLYAGVITTGVGHCHPKVSKAIADQANRVMHISTYYTHSVVYEYLEKLAAKMPGNLKARSFLSHSHSIYSYCIH